MIRRLTASTRRLAAAAVGAALLAGTAAAQDARPADGASGPDGAASDAVIQRSAPVERLDGPPDGRQPFVRTGSPRETMETFLELASRMEFRLDRYSVAKTPFNARRVSAVITEFIEIVDLAHVGYASRRDVATETLALMMDVFGRIEPVALEDVPGAEAFDPDDPAASWRVPGTPLRIVRMTEGDRQGEFLFGPRTPELVESFYARVRHMPLRLETDLPVESWSRTVPQWTGPMIPAGMARAMPEALRDFALDTPIWKILLTGAIALGLAVLVWLANRLLAGPPGRRAPSALLRRAVTPLLMMASAAWAGPFLQFQISPSGDFAAMTKVALVVVFFAGQAWLVWLVIRALFEWIIRRRDLPEDGFDANLWRLAGTVLALLASVLIVGEGATQLGLPLFSVLAGLGIGGLAVALAIRPTLENMIGGIILYIDQPVRVGDFCAFGDKSGTIEGIGVRSTRIRTLDRTVVTVPNASLADMQLINYARCDRMLIETMLGLRYETSADELRFVLASLREMLHAHPRIDGETIRVRFAGYGASSLDVAIRIYALTDDWNEYFAIKEDVLLRMKDVVEAAGSGFAFPSQTLYLGRDTGLDEDRGAAAEAKVRDWRRHGRLPFPRLARTRVEALRGTLDYPPRGSVEAGGEDAAWADSAERLSAGPEEEPAEAPAETEETRPART